VTQKWFTKFSRIS